MVNTTIHFTDMQFRDINVYDTFHFSLFIQLSIYINMAQNLAKL